MGRGKGGCRTNNYGCGIGKVRSIFAAFPAILEQRFFLGEKGTLPPF